MGTLTWWRATPTSILHSYRGSPLFLVGCPRSGTTLLQRLLDSHPDVAITPETHFVRRFWLQRRRYGDLRIDRNYAALVDAVVGMPAFPETGVSEARFRACAWQVRRDHAELFGLLLKLVGETKSGLVVGEKTPNHLLYMSVLAEFFPGARFVHVVRDPRAVVNSWRTVPWSTGSIQGDAEVWRRYIHAARRADRRGQFPFMEVKYERLVSQPAESLSRVCAFAGIGFDESMLDGCQAGLRRLNLQREPWKINVAKAIDGRLADRWRDELPREAIETVEVVAGRFMAAYGYDTMTDAQTRPGLNACATARRLSRRTVQRLRRPVRRWLRSAPRPR